MATIESPIGKVFTTSSKPINRYVVSDQIEDEFDPGIELEEDKVLSKKELDLGEAKALVEKLRKQKETVSLERKSKLEILIGLKRKVKSIKIEGHVIELKTLTGLDFKNIFEYAAKLKELPPAVQLYCSRHAFVASCLYSIDGEKVEDLVGEENDNFETRLAIVENLSHELVGELHDFYEKELHVKQPQNEEEVKEVLKDIKK